MPCLTLSGVKPQILPGRRGVDERVFPTIVDWRTSALKVGMPVENTYSPEAVRILNTHRTPIQKQPEALLCLVGLSHRYYLGGEVYPTFLHDDDCGGSSKGAAAAGDPESENTSFASMVGSPESIYRPEWGITNGSMLDTPEACQDLVDHVALPGYFLELRHLHNDDFLKQYNVNLARQVAMGSQLRLRFEQEAKLLKKSVAQVARRDKRIQARENKIKNLETLLEAEADMKKAAENKSAELSQELENMIAKGMSEGLKHGVEHGQAKLDLEAIEAYKPEAKAKYIAALHALKNLKYPLVDQLKILKDAPMDVIMASLHLESDTEDDAPQWVRELCPSSSQLTIPVYSEVRDPMDPWACKKEILLADAIGANVSRAVKKKKCRVLETSDEASPQLLRSLCAHSPSWAYDIKDAESAAAKVATRLCGRPCIRIFGLYLFRNSHGRQTIRK
nr:hypothetical protein [Tanacetum cinerariifolium]